MKAPPICDPTTTSGAPDQHFELVMPPDTLLILIAPNVSQQMGGEAIKALQIFEQFSKLHPNTVQITHGRNRAEVDRLGLKHVSFVDDTWVALAIWRSRVFRPWLDVWFSSKAVRLAEKIAHERGAASAVIHQTEPNSPVSPRALSRRHVNVFGPINGNIFFSAYISRSRNAVEPVAPHPAYAASTPQQAAARRPQARRPDSRGRRRAQPFVLADRGMLARLAS